MGTSRNIGELFSVKEKDLGLFFGEEDKKSENNVFDTSLFEYLTSVKLMRIVFLKYVFCFYFVDLFPKMS